MINTESMRKGITLLQKQISLRQIGLQSGINYITLRKIKSGETKNVSSGVLARFEAFQKQFDPAKAAAAKKKPGPKPKSAAVPAAAAKKKPGPKPKVAAPAKKKMGRPKKVVAAAPAAPAKKKMGRPKKTATAAAAAPVKKTGAKRGRKPGVKYGAATKSVAEKATNFGSPLLGEALTREIEIAEARIEYLKSLQMVEEEFLRAIGKK